MKILVTGGTGFIGKHLLERLQKDGYNIHTLNRNSYNNTEDLISFMQSEKFDGVIHLASLFLKKHEPKDIKELINSNILFGTEVLEASVESNVSWFINTGTFWQHYQDKEYSPVNLYAATKQAFETVAQYYTETSKINFVTIKLSDTFGPGDTRQKILNLWAKTAENGETLPMSGGKQIIDISYIDNVVDGFCKMISLVSKDKRRKFAGKSFAVNSSEKVSLKKLAGIFGKATGKKLKIKWGSKPYMPREVMTPWKNGKSIPGWKPKISIAEGIRRTFTKIY